MPSSVPSEWYAVVDGAQVGPMSAAELSAKIAKGEMRPAHFVWSSGMKEWKRAREVPILEKYFVAWAPLPKPPAPGSTARKPSRRSLSTEPRPPPQVQTREAKQPAVGWLEAVPLNGSLENEPTLFFIERAGINKRNPPWKVVLFAAAIAGIPIASLAILSALRVVPLEVKHVDESGREVVDSVFSARGVSGLKELLLGNRKSVRGPRGTPAKHSVRPVPAGAVSPEPKTVPSRRVADLGSFYEDKAKKDLGPRVRNGTEEVARDTAEGLNQQEISKVVDRSRPAFEGCIETELRRNPALKGGPLLIIATVAGSGAVTQARVDRRDIAGTNLGDCLRRRAKGLVFRASGEETEVEIPLKVIKSM